jgi:hypothetical protein
VPEPATLAGVKVHDVLLLARLTVPAKPLTEVIVTVDEAAVPALTVTLVGEALMVKSCTVNVTVAL